MTYQPVIVGSGLPAWSLLKSTLSTQRDLHASGFRNQSDTKHFLDKFDGLNTADDIVSDRRVLRVVLGAFGLSEDIDNRHFIKTIMNEGTEAQDALSNRLTDRRYKLLAQSFDFSSAPPNHKLIAGLKEKIVSDFRLQSFEEAVGETSSDMRLALTFQRTLGALANSATTNSAAWFQIMATPPLREVIQTALNLPSEFANLDVDEQQARFIEKANDTFGTSNVQELSDPETSETIVRRFLISQQASEISAASSFQTALVLLSSIPR